MRIPETTTGEFEPGDPVTGKPGSRLSSAYMNSQLRECLNILRAAGIAQSNDDDGQLLAAIRKLIATATDGVLPPVRGGTGLDRVPAGNYLVGNGTGAMGSRTPTEVFGDIGVPKAIGDAFQAVLNSPAFTGAPTAPTPSIETDRASTRIATVQFVDWLVGSAVKSIRINRNNGLLEVVGWWRCGDTGLIRQWGVSRIPFDSEAWVTYAIAFPNMCLGGNATHAERFSVKQDAGVGMIDAGSTAAIIRNGVGADSMIYMGMPVDRASPIYWEVWGK